jgi:replicative DNA helicase
MDVLTGAAIAKLAFDELIKAGAGEIAEKAEAAIVKLEQERSPEALKKIEVYLEDEMDDPQFAQTLQQLAQQVINIGRQEQSSTTFNIDARDNARVNAIGEVNATTVNFGEQRL